MVCDDEIALKLLSLICSSKLPGELMLSQGPKWFRRQWKWLVSQLGLDTQSFQPYGLRRGGACEDFAHHGDAARLCLIGRWGSVKTAKLYAQEALRARQHSELSARQLSLVALWSRYFADRLSRLK